jgi:hypothetical protein
MKYCPGILLSILLLLLTGCQENTPACPAITGTPQYLSVPPETLATPTPASGPIQSVIGSQTMQVDKVVEGPLCNDTWSGTVYVTCNVQVYPWEEQPTFLKNCNLKIEPQTVVYVAYHNNTAYYNGCSCHTGEIAEPTQNP